MCFLLSWLQLPMRLGWVTASCQFIVYTLHDAKDFSKYCSNVWADLHDACTKFKVENEIKKKSIDKIEKIENKKHAKHLAKIKEKREAEEIAIFREEARLRKAMRDAEKAKRFEAELLAMENEKTHLESLHDNQEQDGVSDMNRKLEEKARKKAEKRERRARQEEEEMLQRIADQRRYEERKREQMMRKLSKRGIFGSEIADGALGSEERRPFALQSKWDTVSKLSTICYKNDDAAEIIVRDPITMQVLKPIRCLS